MKIRYLHFIVILIVLTTLSVPFQTFGLLSADQVRQQIADTNLEIKKLDAQIKAYQNQIDQTHEVSTTLKNAISELTLTRNKLITQVAQTSKKIPNLCGWRPR